MKMTGENRLAEFDLVQQKIDALIRDIPDFPKPGILFKDLTPVLADPEAMEQCVLALAAPYRDDKIDRVVGIEARGFLFGAPVALELGVGFVPVRKPGKLPHDTHNVSYQLEYGTDTLEMHVDALEPGHRVLVVDDLLATGGTAAAALDLVRKTGAEIVGCAFLVELTFLEGRQRLTLDRVSSLLSY